MVEEIYHEGQLLSIILRTQYQQAGIQFFTPNHFSQQLGYMKRPTGHVILPHRHNTNVTPKAILLMQEVLLIKSGKVRVDFYDDHQQYIRSAILNTGDVILLAAGGHGFEILETAEMIEVKQGPYCEAEDKVRFEAIDSNQVQLRFE